jgi:hypothetical protein
MDYMEGNKKVGRENRLAVHSKPAKKLRRMTGLLALRRQ